MKFLKSWDQLIISGKLSHKEMTRGRWSRFVALIITFVTVWLYMWCHQYMCTYTCVQYSIVHSANDLHIHDLINLCKSLAHTWPHEPPSRTLELQKYKLNVSQQLDGQLAILNLWWVKYTLRFPPYQVNEQSSFCRIILLFQFHFEIGKLCCFH